jgi:predicted patatin/cPLA2 family phospholipase
MRALVISGGGSKGAFAGGVAEYLIKEKAHQYDLFIGTSTGSLLISHLALGKLEEIYHIYTHVDMDKIFNVNPFIIKYKDGEEDVAINHFNVIRQFVKGKRTFGESKNLLKLIKANLSIDEFNTLKFAATDVVVTVTNISRNESEYKSIKDFEYDEFCEWIWISGNYVPFMSLVTKNGCEYGDGGFSSLVPIQEAINRGATEVDVVILETETRKTNHSIGKNPFSLLLDLFQITLGQVENQNITIGKLIAKNKNVKLNLYYTPIKLTNNALIFNRVKMKSWWKQGYKYAQEKSLAMSDIKL